MKRRKEIFALIAGVMALTSLPISGAAADEVALGDVDMDGVITGHDTAMVSRYVLDDAYTLTEEQLKLADVNEDGVVDQADADKLYNEMQVYALGDADMETVVYQNKDERVCADESTVSIGDAVYVLTYYAKQSAGVEPEALTEVQFNLADVDLDGEVGLEDACTILSMYARRAAGLEEFGAAGKYFPNTVEIVTKEEDENSTGLENDKVVVDKGLLK